MRSDIQAATGCCVLVAVWGIAFALATTLLYLSAVQL
jgi:hypothetical protein